jgi:hypothetical protein
MLQDRDQTVAVIRSILCRRASSQTESQVFFVLVMTPSFLLSGLSSRRQALSLKKTQCGSYRRLFLDTQRPK